MLTNGFSVARGTWLRCAASLVPTVALLGCSSTSMPSKFDRQPSPAQGTSVSDGTGLSSEIERLRSAAVDQLGRSDAEAALASAEAGLVLLGGASNGDDDGDRGRLLLLAAFALSELARHESSVLRAKEAAISFSQSPSHASLEARAHEHAAKTHGLLGESAKRSQHLAAAAKACERIADPATALCARVALDSLDEKVVDGDWGLGRLLVTRDAWSATDDWTSFAITWTGLLLEQEDFENAEQVARGALNQLLPEEEYRSRGLFESALGDVYSAREEWPEAIRRYRRAEGQLADAGAPVQREVILESLVEALMSDGRFDGARVLLTRQLRAGLPADVVDRATAYARLGFSDGELEDWDASLKHYQAARESLGDEPEPLLRVEIDRGRAYALLELGRFHDAEQVYGQLTDVVGSTTPMSRGAGVVFLNAGTTALRLGDPATAARRYERGLTVPGLEAGDRADLLVSLAAAEFELGRYGDAMPRLGRAVQLYESVGLTSTSYHRAIAGRGFAALRLGDLRASITYSRRAIALFSSETPIADIVSAHLNLGSVLGALGRDREAIEVLEEGRRAALGRGGPADEMTEFRLAQLESNLGNRKDDPGEALALYRTALERLETLSGRDGPRAHVLANIAIALGDLDRPDEALEYHEKSALLLDGRRGLERQLATIQANWAGDLHDQGRLEEALPLFAEATATFEQLPWQEFAAARAWSSFARALADAGEAERALDALERSLERSLTYTYRNVGLLDEREREAFLSSQVAATGIALRIASIADASLLPRTLAALLARKSLELDTTRAEREAMYGGFSPETRAGWEELVALKRRRAKISLSISLLGERPGEGDGPAALDARIAQLEQQLRHAAPQVFGPLVVASPKVDSLVGEIGQGAILVEMGIFQESEGGEDRYGGLLLDGGDGAVSFLDFGDRSEIDTLARELARQLRHRPLLAEEEVAATSAALYERLFTGIRSKRAATKRIYFSPAASLGNFPISALATRERPCCSYLAEEIELVHVVSARDLLRPRAGAPSSLASALLVGDPEFGESSKRRWSPARTGPFLRATERQLAKSGVGVELLLGPEATEEAVLDARGMSLLEIATHGEYLSGPTAPPNPWHRGFLVMAGAHRERGGGSARDGLLSAGEVLQLDLTDVSVVALTACDSGLSGADSGSPLAGLGHAFLTAGARAVIMTLFPVPMNPTIRQREHFYRAWMTENGGPFCAFVQAQRRALAGARIRHRSGHPFWWAGFVFYGSPGGTDCPV